MKNHTTNSNNQHGERIQFIVTGFGPFQGVPVNPTTVLVQKLVDYLRMQKPHEYPLLVQIGHDTCTILLETSAEDVQRQIHQIARDHEQSTATNDNNTTLILIHLGVDSRATSFRLEQYAYNTKDFRVPDERGYQPRQERIVSIHALEAPLATLLNVEKLYDSLTKKSKTTRSSSAPSSPVVMSDDPGRFVCNYTYATSLTQFECYHTPDGQRRKDSPESTTTNNDNNVRCLFVHVPPFEVIPEGNQLNFICQLMEAIYDQVTAES